MMKFKVGDKVKYKQDPHYTGIITDLQTGAYQPYGVRWDVKNNAPNKLLWYHTDELEPVCDYYVSKVDYESKYNEALEITKQLYEKNHNNHSSYEWVLMRAFKVRPRVKETVNKVFTYENL